MSRVAFCEDERYAGQFALWEANCRRSWEGKKGQAALKELRDALIALPTKELVSGVLSTADGQCCTIGALAMAKGLPEVAELADREIEEDEMTYVAERCGIPNLVAWSLIYENDEVLSFKSAAERYKHMLKWVESRIAQEPA